jgi:hypothetical protein
MIRHPDLPTDTVLRTDSLRVADPTSARLVRWAIGALWLAIVVLASVHHVFWRDEVHALSLALALEGDGLAGMVRSVHGDGHPLLWYLLLRGAYGVAGVSSVLPVVAVLVSTVAIVLLVWRAPFRWPLVALVALSNFAVWEYSVMARNYGITMLVLFAFAAGYERWRRRGWVVGLWLLLLANTNVHSVLLAGALGLFSRPLARLRRDQPAG